MDLEWTNDSVIQLIEEYKERPQLWDTNHALYRTNQVKYENWNEMAAIFQVDVADVRKKLNSLFASYRREKARVRAGQRSTWFLYPYLTFLPSHVDDSHLAETVLPDKKNSPAVRILNNSISPGALSDPQDDESEQDDEMEVTREEIIIKDEPEVEVVRKSSKQFRPTVSLASSSRKRPQPVRTIRTIKKKIPFRETEAPQPTQGHQSERIVGEVLRLLRRSDHRKKDSCDSFGEYIADSLRKHDEKTQAMIKQAINNIIFEQEMQKYKKSNQYTVVISGMEENPLV